MGQQATFPIYDRLLDGQLAPIIRGFRQAGLSPAQVRDQLRDKHRVTVSEQTMRRWIRAIEGTT